MKIAFDIHGTLDTEPALRKMANFLTLDVNNAVYIISGPTYDITIERLKALGMDPSRFTVISIVDYLRSRGVRFHEPRPGHPYCDEELWWKSKGDICREHGIEIIIDDSGRYAPNMPKTTTFLLNM